MARELDSLTGQSLNDTVKMALQQALNNIKVTQTVAKPRPLSERPNEIALRCEFYPTAIAAASKTSLIMMSADYRASS
ncbi:MAG: hypothetical protein AAF827_09420 [Cyanobacteria bacterium P01_D01_bin.6]